MTLGDDYFALFATLGDLDPFRVYDDPSTFHRCVATLLANALDLRQLRNVDQPCVTMLYVSIANEYLALHLGIRRHFYDTLDAIVCQECYRYFGHINVSVAGRLMRVRLCMHSTLTCAESDRILAALDNGGTLSLTMMRASKAKEVADGNVALRAYKQAPTRP
jgi:hypothetical protein